MSKIPNSKIPIFVEELQKLYEEASNLKEKKQTTAVKNQLRSLSIRAYKVKEKMESIGKKHNIVRVTFLYYKDPWQVFLSDISIEDATRMFDLFNKQTLDTNHITNIKVESFEPFELVEL